MGKYLKMEDVFGGAEVGIRKDAPSLVDCCGVLAANCLCPETAAHIAHAINSHDELVENVLHYEADALMWERRAVTEASRAQELVAKVERLRGEIQDAFIEGCHAGWDMSGEGYNAEYGGPDDGKLHDMFVTKSLEHIK